MDKYFIRELMAIKNYYSIECHLQTSQMLLHLLRARILLNFCKFKYFKDLAKEIDYPIFKINQELGYSSDHQCWLLGFQLKTPMLQPPPTPTSPQTPTSAETIDHQVKQKAQVELEYNPLAKQLLSFGDIQRYAEKNNMDVCIADEQANQVTLIKLRQSIYRKFYQQRLHKKNSTGKKHKEIRVPQKISDHDLLNKVANIRSLIKKGEFRFKLFSENDSLQSQKAVKKLCGFLGRAPQIKIQKYELQEKSKGKRSIIIERWNTIMDFSDDANVNYEQVNRKWRRHLIKLKVQQEKGDKKSPMLDFEGLENQPIEVQREALRDMREMSISFPSKFKDYEMLEDTMEADGKEFYFKNLQKLKKYRDSSNQKVNPFSKKNTPSAGNQDSQSESDSQSDSDSDSESQSQQESKKKQPIRNKNYETLLKLQASPQLQKELRKQMKVRTVEDILEQMQNIRGNKVQLDAFETHRLKALEGELKETLRMGGWKGKI